jgi:hypothetical protein
MNAFDSDEQDEQSSLLNKAKNKGKEENRVFIVSCCVCVLLLVMVVVGFVVALKSLSYPHMVPIHKAMQDDNGLSGPTLKTASDIKQISRGRHQLNQIVAGQHIRGKTSAYDK